MDLSTTYIFILFFVCFFVFVRQPIKYYGNHWFVEHLRKYCYNQHLIMYMVWSEEHIKVLPDSLL